MRPNTKILDRVVFLQCDGGKAKLQRSLQPGPSGYLAAIKSGASGLAERALMMPFGPFMCRATWEKSHSCWARTVDVK